MVTKEKQNDHLTSLVVPLHTSKSFLPPVVLNFLGWDRSLHIISQPSSKRFLCIFTSSFNQIYRSQYANYSEQRLKASFWSKAYIFTSEEADKLFEVANAMLVNRNNKAIPNIINPCFLPIPSPFILVSLQ